MTNLGEKLTDEEVDEVGGLLNVDDEVSHSSLSVSHFVLPSSPCVGSPPHSDHDDERIARKSGVISTPKALIIRRPFCAPWKGNVRH